MANILIVDDDKHVVQQVSEWLTSFGHHVQFTLEPEYLFDLLKTVSIDLILLDVYMPGTDGVEVLKQLKEHSTYQQLPVIMLTADMDDQLLTKCFQQGAADFINKPLKSVVLKARIEAALAVRNSIEQKEILMKEIHHRVKNNLQIISSLFALQTQYTEDQKTLDILRESQNRVDSMALIHERLYGSEDLASIHFSNYVEELASDIFHSYNVRADLITLKVHVENIIIDLDKAIPCALILNELITNTLKYAFRPEQKGELSIQMSKEEDHQHLLIISDNGVGLPEAVDLHNTKSLGLRLVRMLTSQIKGTVEIERHPGTTFKIRF